MEQHCPRGRAARAAHRAPTFVSGQLCLGHLRANPLAQASISRCMNQAVALASHRTHWPETNVGASAARDAPRGRRSICAPPHPPSQAPRGSPDISAMRRAGEGTPMERHCPRGRAARAAHRELRSICAPPHPPSQAPRGSPDISAMRRAGEGTPVEQHCPRGRAARAAHRELRSLLRFFRASYAWARCARTLWPLFTYCKSLAGRSLHRLTMLTEQLPAQG